LQLPWGQLPGLGINQPRHTDRPPLLLGPPHPRTTIARALLFQAPLPGGPLRLPQPRAVVGTIALLDRVAAACNHCTLRPAAAGVVARRAPLQGQALVEGLGAALLRHTPAVQLAYHFCLSLMHDSMLRGRGRFTDRRLAIRRGAPVAPPLARGPELPPPGAVLHERSLVLRNHALDLQQPLLLRTVAEGVMDTDDLTATARAFLQEHPWLGIPPREPVRAPDQPRLQHPCGRQSPYAIQGGAIATRSAGVFVHELASRWDLVCACCHGVGEGVELAGNRLFTFLFVRRYPGIQRGPFHRAAT
jgi:hypothetical protein